METKSGIVKSCAVLEKVFNRYLRKIWKEFRRYLPKIRDPQAIGVPPSLSIHMWRLELFS